MLILLIGLNVLEINITCVYLSAVPLNLICQCLTKIINIVLKDGCAYFLLGEVLTLGFHDHFSAYCIQERPSPFVIVSVKSLFYYEAFDKQYAYNSDGNMYLIPNCHLF